MYSKLFSIALAGLMLGACSSDDVVDNGPVGPSGSGTGYVNLSIKLPTVPASRANDDFDHGDASEYAVKDASLILFESSSSETADDATFSGAYTLKLNFKDAGSNTITTTANATQMINGISKEKVYALVVLNNNGMFTINGQAGLTVGQTSLNASSKISDLNDAVKNVIGSSTWTGEGGFLMSNAALTEDRGGPSFISGNGPVQVLAVFDKAKIHETEEAAVLDPATVVYVQRAVAKVTVGSDVTQTGAEGDADRLNVEVEGWVLDQTNKTSKLIPAVSGYATWKNYATNASSITDKYRFVGSSSVGKNIDGKDLYRIYWGDDFNYSATNRSADLNFRANGSTLTDNECIKKDASAYCFENTTDVTGMTASNCTRIIVKASFNSGNPFFIIDGNVNVKEGAFMTKADDVEKEVAARIIAADKVWIEKNLKSGQTLTNEDFDITLAELKAGDIKVNDVRLTIAGSAKFSDGVVTESKLTEWKNKAAEVIGIEYYANGEAYYPVTIAHFGDGLTPWNNGETPLPTANGVYPTQSRDQNYLGRFGVLRNNWYKINVTSIRAIGSPTIEEATGEPVDGKDSYVSVTVNTLPWAVRTQDAEL